MAEADSEIIKPESMKSYIWLQTSDGSIQQVEHEIAGYCPLILHEIHKGMGSSKNYPISLPPRVTPATLSLILDYSRFHQVTGRSTKEIKSFNEKFIKLDTKRLCELTSAADSLQLKRLVDLTSRALARMIEGKTPEEIRDIFHLPDDLTEEEKLEPINNTIDDPRIRLLNRLYARKRKELKERERLKNVVEVEEEPVEDRSVEDLLSFINSGDGASKGIKTSKNKKKNRRKKDPQKNILSNGASSSSNALEVEVGKQASGGFDSTCSDVSACDDILDNIGKTSKLQDIENSFAHDDEFDTGDLDDDIDPAMKEQIDREVEDFARRLNSGWPERMQELLSTGREKRQIPTAINCNGSLGR